MLYLKLEQLLLQTYFTMKQNWKLWAEYGALGIEMEAAELYTLAANWQKSVGYFNCFR